MVRPAVLRQRWRLLGYGAVPLPHQIIQTIEGTRQETRSTLPTLFLTLISPSSHVLTHVYPHPYFLFSVIFVSPSSSPSSSSSHHPHLHHLYYYLHRQRGMSRRPFSPNPNPDATPHTGPRLRFSLEEEDDEEKPRRLGDLFKRNQSNMFNMSIRAKAFLGGLPEEITSMRPSGESVDVVRETRRKEREGWWMGKLLKVS